MLTARPLLQLAVFIFLASTQVTAHGHKPALGRRSMGATNDVLCLQKNHSGQPQKVPPIVITGKDGRKFCGCANEMDEPVSPRSLRFSVAAVRDQRSAVISEASEELPECGARPTCSGYASTDHLQNSCYLDQSMHAVCGVSCAPKCVLFHATTPRCLTDVFGQHET